MTAKVVLSAAPADVAAAVVVPAVAVADHGVEAQREGVAQEHAVDVGVEPLDQAQQFGLGGGVGQVVAHRDEAALLAGCALVADVDVRGGVVAHAY